MFQVLLGVALSITNFEKFMVVSPVHDGCRVISMSLRRDMFLQNKNLYSRVFKIRVTRAFVFIFVTCISIEMLFCFYSE